MKRTVLIVAIMAIVYAMVSLTVAVVLDCGLWRTLAMGDWAAIVWFTGGCG